MSKVASAERKHIVLIGKRNAGKSSLMNALTGSNLVIVSEIAGTTTDPVRKSIELLPYGPVVLVDTAGYDDDSLLGAQRINKTMRELAAADLVLLVKEAGTPEDETEQEYKKYLLKTGIPFITAYNKADITATTVQPNDAAVSALTGLGIHQLKELIAARLPSEAEMPLLSDLIRQNDIVLLVTPIDLGAPKGRLIMPQVQTIREALDSDAITIVVKDKELRSALAVLKSPPKLIVTDSQAIMRVVADVPEGIPVTTFSILMARYKGELLPFLGAVKTVDTLQSGDKVLIAESCTHHAQEDDIGKVKIPRWLRNYTKKDIVIESINGPHLPDNISDYKLIIHCGGCMITRNAMLAKVREAGFLGVPVTNYGLMISYLHGALPRAITPFPDAMAVWNET